MKSERTLWYKIMRKNRERKESTLLLVGCNFEETQDLGQELG
jgi:hypothetical protein